MRFLFHLRQRVRFEQFRPAAHPARQRINQVNFFAAIEHHHKAGLPHQATGNACIPLLQIQFPRSGMLNPEFEIIADLNTETLFFQFGDFIQHPFRPVIVPRQYKCIFRKLGLAEHSIFPCRKQAGNFERPARLELS